MPILENATSTSPEQSYACGPEAPHTYGLPCCDRANPITTSIDVLLPGIGTGGAAALKASRFSSTGLRGGTMSLGTVGTLTGATGNLGATEIGSLNSLIV